MNKIVRRIAWTLAGLGCACILAGIGLCIAYFEPGGSGVLASKRLADGSEYMVVQTYGEPYNVSFYMRSANHPWGWCYIDHEANRWRDVTMNYDPDSDFIVVRESGAIRAALDRKSGTFRYNTTDSVSEDIEEFQAIAEAPQSLQNPPYPFP